jgi:hypothetical protein
LRAKKLAGNGRRIQSAGAALKHRINRAPFLLKADDLYRSIRDK